MMAFCRHVVPARHGTCCHHAVIMPACVYQGSNHKPGLYIFTFGPIYKPRAWLVFTYVSIDVAPLSPVVLGAESLLRFHRLFSPVKIFNKIIMFGERKFIFFSLFPTAMVFGNPFKKVFTNYYILQIFEVTLSLIFG